MFHQGSDCSARLSISLLAMYGYFITGLRQRCCVGTFARVPRGLAKSHFVFRSISRLFMKLRAATFTFENLPPLMLLAPLCSGHPLKRARSAQRYSRLSQLCTALPTQPRVPVQEMNLVNFW